MRNTVFFLLFFFFLSACAGGHTAFEYEKNPKLLHSDRIINYPAVRFAVMSDLHYYDTNLGITGKAFEEYLSEDRKLLRKTAEILDIVVGSIRREKPDFVLVSGDLTKDGELDCHSNVMKALDKFRADGTKVLVINGNHDISNTFSSMRYLGDRTEPVPFTGPDDFRSIYSNSGYSTALYRDTNSLSYVSEPVPGLWIIVMDSCSWQKNQPGKYHVVGGKFRPETLGWIEHALQKAVSSNKAVIGMMHHGILEHYKGNRKYYPDYVLENSLEAGRLFKAYGMNIVFTGHFHAQDITLDKTGNGWLYDIETGSLSSYPVPWRLVTIDTNNRMTIKSSFLRTLPSVPGDFLEYSKAEISNSTVQIANQALKKFKLTDRDIRKIATQAAFTYMEHLHGDEVPGAYKPDDSGLSLMGKIVFMTRKDLLTGWANDLEPSDNNLVIDLKTGRHE